MFKRLISTGAIFTLALAPVQTFAQDAGSAEPISEEVAEAAAEVPVRRTYVPVNFNAQEDRENILVLDLSNGKRVQIRLMPEWAPGHVTRIKTLVAQGFYDGITFHRVIEGFMAQAGDPTGTGLKGSELGEMKAEFNPMPHLRGSVSMARRADNEDSANSQFFIVFYPRFALDKNYTNFGRVISGMDGVDAIARGEPPANPTRILQASMASDNKPVPAPQAAPAAEVEITADMLSASQSE